MEVLPTQAQVTKYAALDFKARIAKVSWNMGVKAQS